MQSAYPVLQVYEHVVPLQVAVPCVWLHVSPQALQFVVVLSWVHVPLQLVYEHTHTPLEQVGVGCAQAVPFCQVPEVLQVCGVLPLQLSCPGAHTPAHEPLTHVWFVLVQLVALPHEPLEVHE